MRKNTMQLYSLKRKGTTLFLFFVLILLAVRAGLTFRSKRRTDSFQRDILVLYAFSNTNPEYINNLRFFIKEAIERDSESDYYVIVQGSHEGIDLPKLPPHASYMFHANECYDWGTFGWALERILRVRTYSYYFFVNCSVRGPFLPSYAKNKLRWTKPFITMLGRSDVKLVGPAINCEGSPLTRDTTAPWRANPHVQSYAIATDRVGLKVLLDTDLVFRCHTTRLGTIFYSELGASQAILNAGYNLGSFMTKYINVDWRDPSTWNCNKRSSPVSDHYDGVSLDPYEAMFVKYKDGMQSASFAKASRYSDWIQPSFVANPINVTNTSYVEVATHMRFTLLAEAFGRRCFDSEYYLEQNADLAPLSHNPEALWRHFVFNGQFEERPSRLTCSRSSVVRRLFPHCFTCAASESGLPPNTERPKPFSTPRPFV